MLTKDNKTKEFYSVPELAELLGISRVAVFKRIKLGRIKAFKVGRAYIIPAEEWGYLSNKALTSKQTELIGKAVTKVTKEYGKTIEMLGNS